MKIIRNYIVKNVLASIFLIVLALLALDFFILTVNELHDIGKGDYHISQALFYVLLRLPGYLYQFFPAASLLGSLLGLGLLASRSELTVMRAAGVSLWQIVYAMLTAALTLTIIVTVVGETIAPALSEMAENQKAIAITSGQAARAATGLWTRVDNRYIHIDALTHDGQMRGVHIFEFNDKLKLRKAMFAKKAEYKDGIWHLHGVGITRIYDNHTTRSTQAHVSLRIRLHPELLSIAEIDPEELSIMKLHQYIQQHQLQHNQSPHYQIAYWKRIWQPLANCVMMLLAIPFIFGNLRSVTMGLRLLFGVVLGFSFYILNQFFGPVSLVLQIPPKWATLFPTLLFASIALIALRRV